MLEETLFRAADAAYDAADYETAFKLFSQCAELGESAAIRLVGWVRHDGGYIDNIAATRTFPTSGISQTSLAKDNYNDADTCTSYCGPALPKPPVIPVLD